MKSLSSIKQPLKRQQIIVNLQALVGMCETKCRTSVKVEINEIIVEYTNH